MLHFEKSSNTMPKFYVNNEETLCSTWIIPISLWHFHNPKPKFQVPDLSQYLWDEVINFFSKQTTISHFQSRPNSNNLFSVHRAIFIQYCVIIAQEVLCFLSFVKNWPSGNYNVYNVAFPRCSKNEKVQFCEDLQTELKKVLQIKKIFFKLHILNGAVPKSID